MQCATHEVYRTHTVMPPLWKRRVKERECFFCPTRNVAVDWSVQSVQLTATRSHTAKMRSLWGLAFITVSCASDPNQCLCGYRPVCSNKSYFSRLGKQTSERQAWWLYLNTVVMKDFGSVNRTMWLESRTFTAYSSCNILPKIVHLGV